MFRSDEKNVSGLTDHALNNLNMTEQECTAWIPFRRLYENATHDYIFCRSFSRFLIFELVQRHIHKSQASGDMMTSLQRCVCAGVCGCNVGLSQGFGFDPLVTIIVHRVT